MPCGLPGPAHAPVVLNVTLGARKRLDLVGQRGGGAAVLGGHVLLGLVLFGTTGARGPGRTALQGWFAGAVLARRPGN